MTKKQKELLKLLRTEMRKKQREMIKEWSKGVLAPFKRGFKGLDAVIDKDS